MECLMMGNHIQYSTRLLRHRLQYLEIKTGGKKEDRQREWTPRKKEVTEKEYKKSSSNR